MMQTMIKEALLLFKYSKMWEFVIKDSKSEINWRYISNDYPDNWRLKLNSCDVSQKLVIYITGAIRAGYLYNFIRYRHFQVNLLLLLIPTTKAADSLTDYHSDNWRPLNEYIS